MWFLQGLLAGELFDWQKLFYSCAWWGIPMSVITVVDDLAFALPAAQRLMLASLLVHKFLDRPCPCIYGPCSSTLNRKWEATLGQVQMSSEAYAQCLMLKQAFLSLAQECCGHAPQQQRKPTSLERLFPNCL